jgi:hypothetical protein
MPREFIARNGVISLGNIVVSGSITTTGTVAISGSIASASFATIAATASSADNFLVRNTLTAQTLVVQTITSSVDFVTGSTRFGSISENTHQFTGSVNITGSTNLAGSLKANKIGINVGDLNLNNFTTFGLIVSGSIGFGNSGGAAVLVDRDGSGNTTFYGGIGDIKFSDITLTSNYLTIKNAGNVGIGTADPGHKLDVQGTGRFTGALTGSSATFSSSVTAGGNIQTDGGANKYIKSTGFISNQLGQLSDFGGSDAGYYFISGGGIQFVSAGTNRMIINSSGNVGIGVTDLGPDGLSLAPAFNYSWSEGSGNAYAVLFRQRNSAATVMASGYKRSNTGGFASSYGISIARAAIAVGSNNGSIAFFSDTATNVANGTDITPTERMTILNTGNVGIGTNTPVNTLTIQNTGENSIEWHRSNIMQGMIGIPSASNQIIMGSVLNDFCFRATTQILFSTSGDTERMRITSDGRVCIGTITALGRLTIRQDTDALNSGLSINSLDNYVNKSAIHINSFGTGTGAGITFENRAVNTAWIGHRGSSSTDLHFEQENGNFVFAAGNYTQVVNHTAPALMTINKNGNIGAPSGTNIYNASDARLKQNITSITEGLDKIIALNPVKFNWIDGFEPSEDGKDMLGFVAQEVQSVIPEAVEDFGNNSVTVGETIVENPLRVNEKFIIPVLVKAIQELTARVQELENK